MQDFLFDVLCKTLRGNRGTLRLIMPVKEILEMETASCSDMLESQDCCLFVWWKNKVLGFIIFSGNSSVPRSACAWLLTYGYNKRTACQHHLHKITLSWSDPFHISTTAIYISHGECFWQQIKSLSKRISCLLDLCQHSYISLDSDETLCWDTTHVYKYLWPHTSNQQCQEELKKKPLRKCCYAS